MTGVDVVLVPSVVSEGAAFPSITLPGLRRCMDKSSGVAAKSQRSGKEWCGEWALVFWSGMPGLSNVGAIDDASDDSAGVWEGADTAPSPEAGGEDATW
jgi:hypothetical protein